MADIYMAMAAVVLFSAGLFAVSLWLGGRVRPAVRGVLAALSLALLVLAAAVLRDHVRLVHVLPFSNLIVLGNFEVPAAALLAGFVWRTGRIPAWRRGVLLAVLLGACGYRMVLPLYGEPPACRDEWDRGVCLQSSDATCSTASAATLLAHHGIAAGEREMAGLCLTRPRGTLMHGLYRGLKRKTDGTPLRVRPVSGGVEELRAACGRGPVIISVGLSRGSDADPVYSEKYGWTPGVKHTVVLFRFVGESRVEIGDPSTGREQWDVKDLHILYQGEGIQIVGR